MAYDGGSQLLAEPKGGVPQVINTSAGFRSFCQAFAGGTGSVAADAERASGFRYDHRDYLVQFKRAGVGIALIDPLAISESGESWDLLNDAIGDATWIIHDSRQDLPGFVELGMNPRALFDTQLAARMLGLKHASLAAVTEHYFGVVLAKEHSAADWSYRPLPRDWRNYAALDVELLIELEAAMSADLRKQGKDEWARQEFEWLLHVGGKRTEHSKQPWRHISHITALGNDRVGLAIARALWIKRDELARTYDISAGLLLSDSSIIEAARLKPGNAKQFRAIRSLNERVRMHKGNEQDKMFERYAPIQRNVKPSVWRQTIADALKEDINLWPQATELPHDQTDEGKGPRSIKVWKRHPDRYEHLCVARETVEAIARSYNMPADVLIKPQYLRDLCWTDEISKRDVETFLLEENARPWQVSLVAESLSRAIM